MDYLSQIYTGLVTNPVMYRLAEELKLPHGKVSSNSTAFIMMQGVWSWMDVNSMDEDDIGSCPLQAVADAAGWHGKPEVFFDALVNSGLVVKGEDGAYSLRSWREYVFILPENGGTDTVSENMKEDLKREKNRERQRRFRDRQKHESGSVTDNVTGVMEGVTESVTDNVTDSVTDNVTTNVTTNVNVERNVVRDSNNNNNIITNVPRNTYTLPTVTLGSSNDIQEGVTDSVTQGVTDNASESVTESGDVSSGNIIHYLCAYFEKKCNQKISFPLIESIKLSIDNGMDAAVLYEVIDETALRNIDNPSCYILRIITRLCQENVKDVPAYRERNKRYKSRFGKTRFSGAAQEAVYSGFTPVPAAKPSLAKWEDGWLDDVKSYLANRNNDTTDEAVCYTNER